jgi:hypothetical protein
MGFFKRLSEWLTGVEAKKEKRDSAAVHIFKKSLKIPKGSSKPAIAEGQTIHNNGQEKRDKKKC